MNRQKLSQQVMGAMLITLLLVGCGAPAATPIPPTATAAPPPEPVYLSELEPQSASVGWGKFSIGKYEFTSSDPTDNINEGDPIVMHDVEYPHALYAHAPSKLSYNINGEFSQLDVTIGLVDWIECGDGAQFVVLVDGNESYRSPILLASSEPVEVTVRIADGHVLELLTDHGSAKNWHCDWTIWGDPTLR